MEQQNHHNEKNQQNKQKITTDIQQYIDQMTSMEKIVMEIARDHLGSSFCIENSVGFVSWLKKQNK